VRPGTTCREDGVKIVDRNDTATVRTRRGLLRILDEKNVAITSRFAVKYAVSISELSGTKWNILQMLYEVIEISNEPENVKNFLRKVNHIS